MKTESHHKNDENEIRAALQDAFPAVEPELRRDLWPNMLRRMESPAVAVPWYDWALVAGLAGAAFLFPKVLLLFAYHL